ncbi:MAG: GSU2403 family nucleotidyltransferase fold protein [Pseudomonadota bacterium]
MPVAHLITENSENQLRQYADAASVFHAHALAVKEAATVRGSMLWREVKGTRYLIRTSAAGAQHSLGPESDQTVAMFNSFMARKEQLAQRRTSLGAKLDEMRKLNKVYRVGRTPQVVVTLLQVLEKAGIAEQFLTVGTHALYAYESACGVRVGTEALATRDVDLLYDTRQHVAFVTSMQRLDSSLMGIFRKADKTFRIRPDQLQTAVNDEGFEIDVIRRHAVDGDPHPLPMSDKEDDLWAVQVPSGNQLVSARRHEQMVVSPRGDMALMRTVHALDFVRIKTALASAPGRDPIKRPKDALQAQVVQHLWDEYLMHLHHERA